MQLTIDIKDSALDKVMYILENLKSDIKIINKAKTLDIEPITKEEQDYIYIVNAKKERIENPENYGNLNDVNWE